MEPRAEVTMTVRDMIEEIPKVFPGCRIVEPAVFDRSPDWNWFRVLFENGWMLSCGYGRSHYSDNRARRLKDPKDSETVEIAIFDDEGEWYLVEGMDIHPRATTGVLGHQSSDQLFQIVDYISRK